MKYQYTCYDYSKILNLHDKYKLILDKEYIIECTTFDKETNSIVLKLRCSSGVEEISINANSLIETEKYE